MYIEIVWIAQSFVTKLGMVVHHHELEILVEKLVKVTVRAYLIRIWLSAIDSEQMILLQPDLVWWCIILSQSAQWKIGLLWSIIGGSCHKYNFCHDKRFVATKHIFWCNKSMLVATKYLSQQKLYLWQLPPVIVVKVTKKVKVTHKKKV